MSAEPLPAFDPDFASPAEWAAMYRANGLQVVPARYPMRDRTDKRPALANWKEFQEEIVGDGIFAGWFGPQASPSMGLITGRASGNVFVVDLDAHDKPEAGYWWRGAVDVGAGGFEPETWRQVTGGGGRQMFFRAPEGWHAPTNRTPIGVDIRGQGGFAMLPPSHHLSGRCYAWEEGYEPWSAPVLDAPEWLLEAVDRLVEQYGGDMGRGQARAERVAGSGQDFDPFGARVDGREDALTRWVWRGVVELHRACGGAKPTDGGATQREAGLAAWLRSTKTRLKGVDNAEGLERECRGATAFRAKWDRALAKWDARVARDAAQPRPFADDQAGPRVDPRPQPDQGADEFAAAPGVERFKFETVADLRGLPPARWLVKGWVPEGAVGVLYGKWATGKSFLGFDLGLHLAYGMLDWHGADLPEGGCDVLVLAREGHAGFVGRVDAFRRHHGLVEDTDRLVFMRAAVSFMRDDDFGALLDAVRAQPRRFRLILVDTVARVLPGVDMNEQQTVTLFMERCALLGEACGAAVVGVHHQNKSGGMMGSTYFEANADFVFEVTRTGDEDAPLRDAEVLCTKMKDGDDRWSKAVRFEKVGLSDIDPEPASLVVAKIGEALGGGREAPKVSWPDKQVCRDILAEMAKAWMGGTPWSSFPQAKRSGLYAAKRIQEKWGIALGIAEHMIETWLVNDVLAVEVAEGRNGRTGLKVKGGID